MRRLAGFVGLAILPFLFGATCDGPPYSIYPLSNFHDRVVWDPRLVGRWQRTDDTAGSSLADDSIRIRVEVTRAGFYRYRVRFEWYPGPWAGYLTTVDSAVFLDLEADNPSSLNDLAEPVRFFARIRFKGDTMVVGWATDRVWGRHLPIPGVIGIKDRDDNTIMGARTDTLRIILHNLLQDPRVDWNEVSWVHSSSEAP